MEIIDFRVRPLYKGYSGFTDERIRRDFKRFGYDLTPSVIDRTMESLLSELKAENVVHAVVPGSGRFHTTAEELLELRDTYGDLFVPFPDLDPSNAEHAIWQIKTYVEGRNCRGAAMEPYVIGLKYDDPSLDPVYDYLQAKNIPLMITVSGWIGKVIDNTLPAQLDRIMNKFPKLQLLVGHAGWPYIAETICVAAKHPSMYLVMDFESVRGVGGDYLRQSAPYMLEDQLIYASSFPLGPVDQVKKSILEWGLSEKTNRKIFYENGAGILQL